jgi:hydroxymethylpyrimidine/phosphomethylpyrimidine kinase
MLEDSGDFSLLMPEVRVNMVYALPGARTPDDVVAIDGRITAVSGRPRACGLPRYGVSGHMSRLIIEINRYDRSFSAGVNFRCDGDVIQVVEQYCRDEGILCGWIDRTREPAEIAGKEGASMPWKIKYLFDRYGAIPRLFYEGDGWGKEPLYVALGSDATGAAETALEIACRYRKKMKGSV